MTLANTTTVLPSGALAERLLGASTEGFWSWDSAHNLFTDHRQCGLLLGASSDVTGAGFSVENTYALSAMIADFSASDAPTFTAQLQLHYIDESLRWFQIHAVKELAKNFEEARIMGTLRDINDVKIAELTQAAVFQISEAAHTCTELEDLYRRIHHTIAALLPAKNLFIALYDRVEDVLSFPYYVDE